jgi:hypothetical protein
MCAGGGLVEKHDLGCADERHGETEAPLLPARHIRRPLHAFSYQIQLAQEAIGLFVALLRAEVRTIVKYTRVYIHTHTHHARTYTQTHNTHTHTHTHTHTTHTYAKEAYYSWPT